MLSAGKHCNITHIFSALGAFICTGRIAGQDPFLFLVFLGLK
jgi:hypothetical protein